MELSQRHERILAELRVHGSLSAADFAERMGISTMTVRRDLRELGEQGRLRRVHGGAVSVDTQPTTGMPHRPGARPAPAPGAADTLFTFGFVVPDPSYYFPTIVAGAVERAQSLGGRIVLGVSRYDPDRERDQIERLLVGGVDGLLVTTSILDAHPTLELLERSPVPVVLVERSVAESAIGDGLEFVRTDHAAGAVMALRHLAGLGHERIGMAAFDTPTTPSLRLGFERAVRQLGLREDASTAIIDDQQGVGEQTRRYLEACVASGTTAVFLHSDHYAVEFADAALDLGLSIPGDLSIVAYDDEVAGLARVPLTAVAPPKRDIGRFAATMCFERISAAAQTGFAARHTSLRPSLSLRESTAPPR